MKFNKFVLKYKRILFISFAAAISFLLLCLIGFYFWLNYHTMAQIGDYKITRKVVLDNIDKNKDYILAVKGENANTEKEVYQMLLEQKAAEYQSAKQEITVSDQELNAEIRTLDADGNSDNYYKTVSLSYGWSKEEANKQVRDRMLKEKLENSIISSSNVQSFYVRSSTEPKQGETAEQIKAKALELATQARVDAMTGKSFQDIQIAITAASPLTWNGDMTHGWSEVDGLNSSNEADKLANGRFWPAIQKLNKKGDVTDVIDATVEGGLYVFWQLDSKTTGMYNSMTEFYQSFQPKSLINNFLLKMTPTAYAACSNYLNTYVNTADEIAYYRITNFQIKVQEASTHDVITTRPNAHVVTNNIEPADGHCDSSWCTMNQDDVLGTNGQATMYNSCCQFTYDVSVTGLDGFSYVHTYRSGNTDPTVTTHYPPHFNGVNGVNNMYGQMEYNPIPINIVNYTLTYVAGTGGTINGVTSQTVASGGSGTAVTAVANAGYQPASPIWNDGNTLATRTETNVTATATYTASFVPIPTYATYTLSYSCNGGTGTQPNSQQVTIDPNLTYGVATVAGQGSCAKACNAFSAWNIVGFLYQPGDIYHISKDRTAYAYWTPNQLTLSYNANGGSSAPAAQLVSYGSTTTLSSTVPTRAGYSFTGWYLSASGTGTSYASGASYGPMPSCNNVTLYAGWKPDAPNTYSLSTSVASGLGTVSGAGTYNSGETAHPVATPSEGWGFSSWTGDCAEQDDTADVLMNSDKNCAADFVSTNRPLDVHLETPADATVYTTSVHGGTADVSLAAHATDADASDRITMQISYQVAGSSDWMVSSAITGGNDVPGTFAPLGGLSVGTYYWTARAVTGNSEDGTVTAPIRTLTIQDLPATPSLSCAVVPLAGSSPAVIKVDYTVTDGNGGTVSVNMGDGSPLLTSGSPVYHTYETAGVFNVTVTYSNTADMSQCPVRKVTVKDPTSGTGTEVAP